jgi:uncharacterized protein YbaR (Trm112 family)
MDNEELLSLLVCPLSHSPLRREGEALICTRCGAKFAIQDGIPNMLIEEAELPPGCASIEDLECARGADVRLDK